MSGIAPVIIPVLVTIATAIILATLRVTANRVKASLNEAQVLKEERDAQRAKDQYEILQRIEEQTKLTNGRVTRLEADLLTETKMLRERLAHIEGQYETVMQIIHSSSRPL